MIIKKSDNAPKFRHEAFNFDDMAVQAERYLAEVREKAAAIVQEAQQQAATIRKQAEQAGREAGMQAVEKICEEKIHQQVQSLMPALKQAIREVENSRQAWLQRWEQNNVHLACRIAERIIRRQLDAHPEITLDLVRDALEIAAQQGELILKLHPEDHATLGKEVTALIEELARLADVTVVADAGVSRGGCVAETRFGTIDEQIETQLARIEQELR